MTRLEITLPEALVDRLRARAEARGIERVEAMLEQEIAMWESEEARIVEALREARGSLDRGEGIEATADYWEDRRRDLEARIARAADEE